MTENDYREILRNMPCAFCSLCQYGLISWHHLKCLQQSGTAMKPPAWATIPVCDKCHKRCHSYEISRTAQISAMLFVWVKVGADRIGAERFWEKLGKAYWSIIQ